MPKVPVYTPQVQQQGPSNARFETNAPIEAFGGGAAAAGRGAAVGAVSDVVENIWAEEKKRADSMAVVEAERKLVEEQTAIESGIRENYQGQKSLEAWKFASEEWQKNVPELEDQLTNVDQRTAFTKLKADRWTSMNRFVQSHTDVEYEKYETANVTASIVQSGAQATAKYYSDYEVNSETARAVRTYEIFAKAKGITPVEGAPSPQYTQKVKEIQSTINLSVIDARLNNGMYEEAKKFYGEAKKAGTLTGEQLDKATDKMESARVVIEGDKIIDKVRTDSRYLSPGGGINQGAVFEDINTRKEISPTEKAKLSSYVKARIQEENVRDHQRVLDTDKAFQEWAASHRKAGTPISSLVTKIPPQFYRGNFGEYEKQQQLYKIYNPTQNPNVGAALALGEKIRNGGGSYKEIEDLRGLVDEKMYYGLRRELGKRETEGLNQSRNQELVHIKDELNRKYQKARKKDGQEIFHQVQQESLGLDGNQTRALYEQKIKDVVVKPGYLWDDTKPQWQIDREKNKQRVTPGAAATSDAINNAVNTLRQNGKKTDPDTVRRFLQKYPTGKIQ